MRSTPRSRSSIARSSAGSPVIVGGDERRGVVSAASYRPGNPASTRRCRRATAKRLCPKGVFLPVRMSRLRGDVRQGVRHLPPIHPPDRAALHRRGVPRRDGLRAPVRLRGGSGTEDQGGGAGRDGADRVRGRGDEQIPRQDRVGSREAGWPHGRLPRERAGFPGPSSGGEAVGGGEGDGGGAPGTGDPDDRGPAPLVAGDAGANLRRARGAPARTGPGDRRPSRRDGTRGEVGRPRRYLRPRSARSWCDAAGAAFGLPTGCRRVCGAGGSGGRRSR